jgi:ribosome recycling factor
LDDAKDSMEKALKHTAQELSKIRAGKALPSMLDGIMVNYYGSMSPIGQVANINNADARTLVIKPWEKAMLAEIEKSIKNSDLGINPMNDGEIVRLVIPPLTGERRKDLVKQAKNETEAGKVRIRTIRKETNEDLKKLLKEGASEDAIKAAEAKVQTLTDNYIKKLDDALVAKEQDIMTV